MHAQLVTALVLFAALPRVGCGGSPSGDQPACVSGATQPQTRWFLAGEDPELRDPLICKRSQQLKDLAFQRVQCRGLGA